MKIMKPLAAKTMAIVTKTKEEKNLRMVLTVFIVPIILFKEPKYMAHDDPTFPKGVLNEKHIITLKILNLGPLIPNPHDIFNQQSFRLKNQVKVYLNCGSSFESKTDFK